jgi:antitoxin component YwqK of YwqJK toxin-antitoxin module
MEYKDSLLVNEYSEWWEDGEEKVKGQYNKNQKDGQWIYYDPGRRSRYEFYDSDSLISFYNFEYYDNGQLTEEPSFDNGIVDGQWFEYFINGEKSTKREYNNMIPDGEWITRHDKTFNKSKEMEYKDSLLVNEYREWWSNGEKKVIGQYTENKQDGQWMRYDPGGTILLEDKYSGWLDRGEKYAPNRRSRYEYYHFGELISSYNFEYYSNGQLKEEPSFTKGILDGIWKEYFKDGEGLTRRGYRNGKPDGEWITWHDSTFVKAQEMTFVD